jgi:hypothetical protein
MSLLWNETLDMIPVIVVVPSPSAPASPGERGPPMGKKLKFGPNVVDNTCQGYQSCTSKALLVVTMAYSLPHSESLRSSTVMVIRVSI